MAGKDDLSAIQGFVEEFGVGAFPHVIDDTGEIWAGFGVNSQPAFTFIDDDGTSKTEVGALGKDGLAGTIDKLITN